ncbi:MAG TPA: efflux RND transporter periplasmic adaptor subunit [Planctomycetota bacterium]|jgi:Cu(I)/Ag(I) efflux system membrane fusion protein
METTEHKTGWQKALFVLKLIEIRLRFVAILVITALVVGYWDVIQNYWERWTRPAHTHTQAESDIEYTCAMHPFVARETPGKCPICGMDLIPRKKGGHVELPEGTLARVQISPDRIIQAGVQIEPVAYRLLSRTVRSYGTIEMDDTRVARITLRFPGRVDELMVNAVGMEVKKGDPLASVYSPKFLAISQEYIQALEAKRKTDADPQANAESKSFSDAIVQSTRKRLSLAGFTGEQLEALEKAKKASDHVTFYSPLAGTVIEKNVLLGDQIEEGMTLYTVADLTKLWVQVQIVESDMAAVKVGMPVEITDVAWPGEIFYGNVELIYPTLNTETRAIKARLAVDNAGAKLKPGMFVTAVLRSPLGRYGQIGTPGEPKPEAGEQTEAVSGAYPLDYCVVTGAKLGEMGDPVVYQYEGRTIKFCCDSCPPKFKADPAKYLKLIDEAAAKIKRDPGRAHWVEGWACPMHPDLLVPESGPCTTCGCKMPMVKWRVERVLSLPETAVVDTGTRQIVYVQTLPGVYDARAVTLGPRAGVYYQVLGGLKLGDQIVSRGSFLIDAEARLNPAEANAAPASDKPAAANETKKDEGAANKAEKAPAKPAEHKH